MTMQGSKHTDGGTLESAVIVVELEINNLLYLFSVNGLRCTQCEEEVISRDTALWLEQAEEQIKKGKTIQFQEGILSGLGVAVTPLTNDFMGAVSPTERTNVELRQETAGTASAA